MFSNIIMTMCPKLGTRGRGVAVGVCEAVGTRVGVGGTDVAVNVAVGMGDITVGGADVAQAVSKTNRKIQKPNRFICVSLKNKPMLSAPGTAA